jgi:hypothetical protein
VFSPQEAAQITRDFIRGELRLPPRFRERGPEFAWNAHVLGWWRRLFAAAPPDTTSTIIAATATSAVVNFDEALADPVAAIQELLQFCNMNASAGAAGQDAEEEAAVAAAVIAAHATREVTARVVMHARGDGSNAVEAAAHFPIGSEGSSGGGGGGGSGSGGSGGSGGSISRTVVHAGQKPPPSWARDFLALPAEVQALFNRSHSAWDLVVRGAMRRGDDGEYDNGVTNGGAAPAWRDGSRGGREV